MKKRGSKNGISVHLIAGTEVVLLGLDAQAEARENLVGFEIERRNHADATAKYLAKSNEVPIQKFLWGDYTADPGIEYTYVVTPKYMIAAQVESGESIDVTITTENPDDGTHAIYFNRGVAGSQGYARRFGDSRRWYLTAPGSEGDEFNSPRKPRAMEFIKPEHVPLTAPTNPDYQNAYQWLSRGLEEAMLAFIGQANNSEYSIRAAVYEFTYIPVIQAFVDALEAGADVKIIHHAKEVTDYKLKQNYDADTQTNFTMKDPSDGKTEIADPDKEPVQYKNREVIKGRVKDAQAQAAVKAVSKVGLSKPADPQEAASLLKRFDQMMIERKVTQISHNKFIILMHNDVPIEVWTGSTNFTGGGLFGQSNVGHIVRDPDIAQKYFDYWEKLSTDPKKKSKKNDSEDEGMQNWVSLNQPDLTSPPSPNSLMSMFSPRLINSETGGMLQWYANQLAGAKTSVFYTTAFSISDEFMSVLAGENSVTEGAPYQRYILLESDRAQHLVDKIPDLQTCAQNRLAWGDLLRERTDDEELAESLTGLNTHVNYLHTKYMLLDALSDDPIVISGSANFSTASMHDNDENMLIIRGNTRVADIYLTEYMRLFNHFYSRNRRNELSDAQDAEFSEIIWDDSWTASYYDDPTSQDFQERVLFA